MTVEARRVGANVEQSEAFMQVGADIYPPAGTPSMLLPGAGISSLRRLGRDWTPVTMTTFAEQTRNGTGITHAQLRGRPPSCAAAEPDNQGEAN